MFELRFCFVRWALCTVGHGQFLLAKLRKLLFPGICLSCSSLGNFPSSKKRVNLYESPIIHIEAHRFLKKIKSTLWEVYSLKTSEFNCSRSSIGPISYHYVFVVCFLVLDAYYFSSSRSHLDALDNWLYTSTRTNISETKVLISAYRQKRSSVKIPSRFPYK